MKHSDSGPSRMPQGHRRDRATAFMILKKCKKKEEMEKENYQGLEKEGRIPQQGTRTF